MPKVVFNFDPAVVLFTEGWLKETGTEVRKLVAAAASTIDGPLGEDDVDWFPMQYPPGSLIKLPVGIELLTFGFPARVEKLRAEANLLKHSLWKLLPGQLMRRQDPLLWIRFQDPDGLHI